MDDFGNMRGPNRTEDIYQRRAFGKEVLKKTVDLNADGAQGALTLFTVTSDVKVKVYGICTETLTGATATIEVGVASGTALIIAQTTATNIEVNEGWVDATPALAVADPGVIIVPNGQDIIATIATADITDGTLDIYCEWEACDPDDTNAEVVVA
jgi:hypothetical protein